MDEHFDVERTEKGQKPEHPGYEQLEGKEDKEDPVIAKVEGERLLARPISPQGLLRGRAGAARRVGQEGR